MARGDDDSEPKKEEIFSTSSFTSLGLHPNLCSHLQEKLGFEVPTLIQAQAIPVILSGRHVLVSAATGTGKTVTYLAPIIHHLQSYSPKIDRSNGTLALVLVPTRELCLQVYEILTKMLQRFIWIVPGYIMGGENRSKEKARLRKGISVLVATPGRLLDHLKNTSSFTHTDLRWIIFDEADRILELGYGKEIEEILDILGSRRSLNRQNILLSATLNEKVNHLANISLDNPISIGLDSKSQTLEPDSFREYESEDDAAEFSSHTDDYKLPTQLMQQYIKVPCSARLAVLLSVLHHRFSKKGSSQKIVVFFSTCDAVDFHYSLFCEFHHSSEHDEPAKPYLGCKTFKLHGNMAQEDRRTNFMAFKASKLGLLLCTDVAARGLDFPQVKCIIQYDSPGEATEYVHRVGRTARLGEKGESLLFLQPIEVDYLTELGNHAVKLSEFPITKVVNRGSLLQARKFCALDMHPYVLSIQKALEALVLSKMEINTLAQKAFCSWVRAYTAHRGELKNIFMVKKLHLGHVAKSFALKQTPSLVGKSHMKQLKRKCDYKNVGQSKKRRKLRVIP